MPVLVIQELMVSPVQEDLGTHLALLPEVKHAVLHVGHSTEVLLSVMLMSGRLVGPAVLLEVMQTFVVCCDVLGVN